MKYEDEYPTDNWTQYQKLVLTELTRHSKTLEDIKKELGKIDVEIATLKIKATLFGAIGASIPTGIVVLYELLKK